MSHRTSLVRTFRKTQARHQLRALYYSIYVHCVPQEIPFLVNLYIGVEGEI
jgi:hypothetical protein